MFIGHLPAGIIVANLATKGRSNATRRWWAVALLGSVFPDFDMFYFYFVDGRQTLHHHYWTHLPFVWLCLTPLLVWHPLSRLFLVNVLLHLVLDSLAGGILWLWPFSSRSFVAVEVPAAHAWWVWNFVLHWSFLPELLLLGWALLYLFRRWRAPAGYERSLPPASATVSTATRDGV